MPDVEFALVAEAGPLEAQARLLVDSLRRFGGRHANAAVTVVSPRRSRRPSQATLRALRRAGARYVALDLASACPDYPTSWRVHALAHVERQPGPDVLVQLDSDALFPGDVGELCADARAAGRPIDVKGMATTGPGDGYEPYWAALCGLASVDLEALPFVRTTVDDIRVRAVYNGGFVAAPRDAGLFTRADELLRRTAAAGLRPHAGRGLDIVAGTGAVGHAGSEWWGLSQAATSVAAASLNLEIAPLPEAVNVPMHLWDDLARPPARVVHAHYHWLLAAPLASNNPLLDGRAGMMDDQLAWLADRVPLAVR